MIDNKLASITRQHGTNKTALAKAYHDYLAKEFTPSPLYLPPELRANELALDALQAAIEMADEKDPLFLDPNTSVKLMDFTYLAAFTLSRQIPLSAEDKEMLTGYFAGMRALMPNYTALVRMSSSNFFHASSNDFEMIEQVGSSLHHAHDSLARGASGLFHRVFAGCSRKPVQTIVNILTKGGNYYNWETGTNKTFPGFLSDEALQGFFSHDDATLQASPDALSAYAAILVKQAKYYDFLDNVLQPRLAILTGEPNAALQQTMTDLSQAMDATAKSALRHMTIGLRRNPIPLRNPGTVAGTLQFAATLFHADENIAGTADANQCLATVAERKGHTQVDVMQLWALHKIRQRGGC